MKLKDLIGIIPNNQMVVIEKGYEGYDHRFDEVEFGFFNCEVKSISSATLSDLGTAIKIQLYNK